MTSKLARSSGILLHPTSLPGPYGIGDMGPEAYRFVDFLSRARQCLWQVLPLNPPGIGHSPYAAPSAFAGNALLLSVDQLIESDLLHKGDLAGMPRFPANRVEFGAVARHRAALLHRAYERCRNGEGEAGLRERFEEFCSTEAEWLEDYSLFMALREHKQGLVWTEWEAELVKRSPEALERSRAELAGEMGYHRFLQFVFFRQWAALRRYANERGVRLIGDIPIFVAHDSVDVWAHRELFHLDYRGLPTLVAGVPPDYFSKTGQRWGNPLYRWDVLAESGYEWWVHRLRATLALVDAARIDHFRGFQACWAVPAEHETAEHGEWILGPGRAIFDAMSARLGDLPIIVEDLGFITSEVTALRDELGFPGMKVLQFAFGSGPDNPYLPHNHDRPFVVYTATHDNDTTVGWFDTLPQKERAAVLRYLGTSGRRIADDLVRTALASVAELAIVPLQDILALPGEARMNVPGKVEGNWAWRLRAGQLTDQLADRLAELTETYGRAPRT